MTFDALLTLGFVMEQIAVTGETLAGLVDDLPHYAMRKCDLPCPPNLVYRVLDRFRALLRGLSARLHRWRAAAGPEARLHIRASNTEPLLRIIVEADRRRHADAIMEDALTQARRFTHGHVEARKMPGQMSLKVGISGVRGIVGESLTPQLVTSFAAAFGNYCGAGPSCVGTDNRPSGEMIKQAAVAGLLSVGCTPVDVGIVPIPALMLHVRQSGAFGGIGISASHNPIEWNALKFIGP